MLRQLASIEVNRVYCVLYINHPTWSFCPLVTEECIGCLRSAVYSGVLCVLSENVMNSFSSGGRIFIPGLRYGKLVFHKCSVQAIPCSTVSSFPGQKLSGGNDLEELEPSIKLPLSQPAARSLAQNLTAEDRHLLLEELQRVKGDEAIIQFASSLARLRWRRRFGRLSRNTLGSTDPTGRYCEIPSIWLKSRIASNVPKPLLGQLLYNALFNSLPFIGFGFLDNVIMITAGDYIEASMGVALGISTMAAAALGNTVSDVAGIGSAFYVEVLAMRVGLKPPSLTTAQLELNSSQWSANIGRALGVAIGCLIGMFPLMFLPSHTSKDGDTESDKGGSVVVEVAPAATSPDPQTHRTGS